jgi:aspartate-semialdehyde dehydrogenase
MTKKKLGFVGFRGMVGSVLVDRMQEEGNFKTFCTTFFSSSLAGETSPNIKDAKIESLIVDSTNLEALMEMDIILTCQGGEYTNEVKPKLDSLGFKGYWVDASSAKRMDQDSLLVLDPLNENEIIKTLNNNGKNFIGANCTVSLMMLGVSSLFKNNLIEWVSSMTYQAASGGGAQSMIELLNQTSLLGEEFQNSKELDALSLERKLTRLAQTEYFPQKQFSKSLALNLLPWIDSRLDSGQSKEEWKAQVEANKILNSDEIIPIDGTCVRVGVLRAHSQALTIKLKKSINLETIEEMLSEQHVWSKFIKNDKESTLAGLTPLAVSGSLDIAVGRARFMNMGEKYLNIFTLGDQLLWGAAEPLRRMLVYLK